MTTANLHIPHIHLAPLVPAQGTTQWMSTMNYLEEIGQVLAGVLHFIPLHRAELNQEMRRDLGL